MDREKKAKRENGEKREEGGPNKPYGATEGQATAMGIGRHEQCGEMRCQRGATLGGGRVDFGAGLWGLFAGDFLEIF